MSNGIEKSSPNSVSRQGSNTVLTQQRLGYPLFGGVPPAPGDILRFCGGDIRASLIGHRSDA
jgi:hypothetical protein